MAVPSIFSMLVTSLYNMADTFFVGQIDTPSTAAVGLVFPVMFLIQAVAFRNKKLSRKAVAAPSAPSEPDTTVTETIDTQQSN